MNSGAATAPAPPRRRRFWRAFAALAVGLVGALAALELAFRWFWTLPPWFVEFQQAGMYVAAPDGDIALRPGYRGRLRVDTETTVAINALGMRGPELAAKAQDERRVLVLGDSMVWGYGVEAAQALPACIEAALREQGMPATAGNAGVPGYGSRHAVAQMARLAGPFGADAFVLCACLGNDALDDLSPERTVHAGLMLQGMWARLVGQSWRARLMYRSRASLWFESWLVTNHVEWSLLRQLPSPGEHDALARGLPQDRTHAGVFLDVIDEATTWAEAAPPVIPGLLRLLRTSLQRAREVAGARPVLFVVLPTSWQVLPVKHLASLRRMNFAPERFERGLAQRRWLAVAREAGFVPLDATTVLERDPDPASLFLSDGGHFSERGNDVVGRWLAAELAPLLRVGR